MSGFSLPATLAPTHLSLEQRVEAPQLRDLRRLVMPHVLDVDLVGLPEAGLLPQLGVLVREVLCARRELVDLVDQASHATLLLEQLVLERMDLIHSLRSAVGAGNRKETPTKPP